MKKLNIFFIAAGLLCMQQAMAQTKSHLELSTEYPEVGQKIKLSYNPAGTPVEGKDSVSAIVYFFDNKSYPAADVSLSVSGKIWKGELSIPDGAKAFLIKIASDGKTDTNDGKGYLYEVFKGKKPVPGAYAMEALVLMGTCNNIAGVKIDNKKSMDLYKQEFELHPDIEKNYANVYYYGLLRSPEYKPLLDSKIDKLEKSNDEKDVLLAIGLLVAEKKPASADSLVAIVKTKYPNGIGVKNNLSNAIFKEKDPSIKEELYKAYKTKYPTGDEENDEHLKTQLAMAYLYSGQLEDFRRVEATLKSTQDLIAPLDGEAYALAKKGQRLDEAKLLSKQALDMVKPLVEKPQVIAYMAPSAVQRNNKTYYALFAETYAYISLQQNKLDDALSYEEIARAGNRGDAEHYVLILDALGKTDEALKAAAESVKSGSASDIVKEKLKKNYIAKNGSEAGYDQFLADLNQQAKGAVRAKLAASMINEPAPDFTLKDLDGNAVSLASLKGKTVVVDFWATWCGPCKASFPGMQMAVSKYKDDPNIKFLFIDTWETAPAYQTEVKNFVSDNKYTFHVLLDEFNDAGKQAKVVSTFGVTGIPTKFVIDKNGRIRFKYVGYSGSADKVAEEVSNMLELTANAGNEKVSAESNTETKEKSK